MTQIAQKVGVSVAVVSRLLRGDPSLRISEKRRREILTVKERLGGVRTRRQKRQHNHTILAPVNRSFSEGWISETMAHDPLIRSFEKSLGAQGYYLHFILFDPEEKEESLAPLIRSGETCEGMLLLSKVADEHLAELFQVHDFPHVSIDPDAERFRVNTVCPNVGDGMRQAIEHLQALGHQRIGYLGPPKTNRFAQMVAAMTLADLRPEEQYNCWMDRIQPNDDVSTWRELARRSFENWLARDPKSTAMFCYNDYCACGAIDAMLPRGLQPGRDLSLIGYDDLEGEGLFKEHAGLTTIDKRTDLVGQRLGELLLNQIRHNQTQICHERIPVSLIVRQSTGPCTT